jgi:hypothetical protein
MGGKILLFFPLKNKRLEGQRETMLPRMSYLSLHIKKKAPVVELMLLI